MEPISLTIAAVWFGSTAISGIIGNRIDSICLNYFTKKAKEFKKLEKPTNIDLQKVILSSHWLATKIFLDEIIKKHTNKEFFDGIMWLLDQQLDKVKDEKYIINPDSFQVDLMIQKENSKSLVEPLKEKLIDFHLSELKQILTNDNEVYEILANAIKNNLKNLNWFDLVCAFLNELLTGDNNKAKDAFQNQELAKIGLEVAEIKQVLAGFEQNVKGFISGIGEECFEEFKRLVHTGLQEIASSLSSLYEKVDESLEINKEILKIVIGNENSSENTAFLTGVPVNLNLDLIGRDEDLKSVIQILEDQNRVMIYGMKGIGKTTLSKFVVKRLLLENKLDHVIWLANGNDLQNAFKKDIGEVYLSNQVKNAVKLERSSLEIIERIIIPYLINLGGNYNLIVIDNLTIEQYSMFRGIIEKLHNWKILTTSFQKLGPQRDDYQLNLLPLNHACALFYSYYTATIDDSSVAQLVAMVGYHTLTIEILAKTASSLDLIPLALLKRFEENGLNLSQYDLDIEINHSKDLIEGLLPYYMVIFNINELSIIEQNLLIKLSVFPSLPFKKRFIISLINTDSVEEDLIILALKNLEKRGWVFLIDEAYQMHQVIQLVIQQRNDFSIEKCRKLIDKIAGKIEKEFQTNRQSISSYILIAESIQSIFRFEKDKSLLELSFNLALFYFNVGNYEKAKIVYLKILDEYAVNDMDLTLIYNNLGLIYEKQHQFKDAFDNLTKSLNLRKQLFGDKHEEVSTTYNSLGNFFSGQNDLGRAMFCLQEAHKILLDIYEDTHPKLSGLYNNIGEVFRKMGDKNSINKAKWYYLKSLSIIENGEIGLEAANVYNNLGIISEGDEKKDYYQKALSIRRNVYGEIHPKVAESWGNLGIYYLTQKDFLEAVKNCEKSLTILWEIYKEEHPAVAKAYINLGTIYDVNEQFDKALENYFKGSQIVPKFFNPSHPDCSWVFEKMRIILLNPKAITLFEYKIQKGNLNEDDKNWHLFMLERMYEEQKISK